MSTICIVTMRHEKHIRSDLTNQFFKKDPVFTIIRNLVIILIVQFQKPVMRTGQTKETKTGGLFPNAQLPPVILHHSGTINLVDTASRFSNDDIQLMSLTNHIPERYANGIKIIRMRCCYQ